MSPSTDQDILEKGRISLSCSVSNPESSSQLSRHNRADTKINLPVTWRCSETEILRLLEDSHIYISFDFLLTQP